jgi:hypothetical protein
MAYSITINSSAAARALAAEKGYNVVFAKGVKGTGCDVVEFNTAWFVLNPNDMGDSVTVSWDAPTFSGTYQDDLRADGAKIEVAGNIVDLEAGGVYHVDENGTMGVDLTLSPIERSAYSRRPDILFTNHYYRQRLNEGYYPVLLTQDPAGNKVPFWALFDGTAVRIA